MEVEAQVAQFLRFSPAVLCRRPEVRARTRASGRQPARSLVTPDTQCVLTRHPKVAPPSGRHFCETAQHD
eukprot:841056-Prymnesium_polylepis.1